MTIRTNITGTFTSSNFSALSTQIAWSGTTSEEDRAEQEAERAELREEVRAHFDSGAHTVHVEAGQIVSHER